VKPVTALSPHWEEASITPCLLPNWGLFIWRILCLAQEKVVKVEKRKAKRRKRNNGKNP